MKLTNKIVLAGIAALIAGTVSAQTSVPNTFSADTTASATEVNANFSALVSAVNALSARVDELEADPSVTLEDVVGRTYCFIYSGNFTAQDTNYGRVNFYVGKATLAITSTTQGTFTGVSDNEHELGLSVGVGPALEGEITQHSNNDSGVLTILGLSNGVLSTNDGDFYLSSDGNVILATSFDYGSDETESSINMAVRCD